jgi:hypothetical protein
MGNPKVSGELSVPTNELSDVLTKHAVHRRMYSRRIPEAPVVDVLAFRREVRIRGAVIYAVGKNEVDAAKRSCVDLRSREGLHVVCSSEGTVLTVYRPQLHRPSSKHGSVHNLRLPSSDRRLQMRIAQAA